MLPFENFGEPGFGPGIKHRCVALFSALLFAWQMLFGCWLNRIVAIQACDATGAQFR